MTREAMESQPRERVEARQKLEVKEIIGVDIKG